MKKVRDSEIIKFDCIDSMQKELDMLIPVLGKNKNHRYELPSPIMVELTNPMARFSCLKVNRDLVAKSAAEALYAFSGMNGNDFIWEFRGWEDPRKEKKFDNTTIGESLRFYNRRDYGVLDYQFSNRLRQNGTGFLDQIAEAACSLKVDKDSPNVVLHFISTTNIFIPIFQSWVYCREDKLNIMTWAGYLDKSELLYKYTPIFSFILQMLSELTKIEMGSVQFTIGCLHTDGGMNVELPIVNTGDFRYPYGSLSLRDMDTLMSIMVEFVSRLDENSLCRANPFEGDNRIQMWNDYAEIFRAWKAEKLGYKIEMEQNFFHPQLRFIYKGETT